MKAKLAENGMDESLSQNLSQSQMTNMMQTMSQRSSTAGGYGISQTQTVSGSQDKSLQRYGAGTGASFFFGNLVCLGEFFKNIIGKIKDQSSSLPYS